MLLLINFCIKIFARIDTFKSLGYIYMCRTRWTLANYIFIQNLNCYLFRMQTKANQSYEPVDSI